MEEMNNVVENEVAEVMEEVPEVQHVENEDTCSYHELPIDEDCEEEFAIFSNYGAHNNPENQKALIDMINHNVMPSEWTLRRLKLLEKRVEELEKRLNEVGK